MNLANLERAQLVAFAYREARHTGSLDCMKAICYVLRNRLKAGWGNGTWLSLMESADQVAGNLKGNPCAMDAADRLLQFLARDIDDIYLGTSDDDTKRVVQQALYYQFITLQPNEWFVENIVRDPQHHPRIGHVGPIALFA